MGSLGNFDINFRARILTILEESYVKSEADVRNGEGPKLESLITSHSFWKQRFNKARYYKNLHPKSEVLLLGGLFIFEKEESNSFMPAVLKCFSNWTHFFK